MGHRVNHVELSPLAKARMTYEPTHEILFIENGKPSETAEEMARQVVVYYDKEDGSELVAIRVFRQRRGCTAAICGRRSGKARDRPRPERGAAAAQERLQGDPDHPNPASGVGTRAILGGNLRFPLSDSVHRKRSFERSLQGMARDVHILYGKDDDNPPWWSAVAIRIDRADIVLKPFVDALLAKYGIRQDMNPKQPEQESSND